MTYREFIDRYGNVGDWLQYRSVCKAIPEFWKFCINTEDLIDTHIPKYVQIKDQKNVSRWVYHDKLATNAALRYCCTTWYKKEGLRDDINDFRQHFVNIKKVTNIIKLQDFQYRLLHNKIFCNDVLVYWKKVSTNVCNICKREKQTIRHLLYGCCKSKHIWDKFESDLVRNNIKVDFTFYGILFNKIISDTVAHICNLLVLIIKQYLYRCKCQDKTPRYEEICSEMGVYYHIELYNASLIGKSSKIIQKWSPVFKLLSGSLIANAVIRSTSIWKDKEEKRTSKTVMLYF